MKHTKKIIGLALLTLFVTACDDAKKATEKATEATKEAAASVTDKAKEVASDAVDSAKAVPKQ